jgi:hypothetical protein
VKAKTVQLTALWTPADAQRLVEHAARAESARL